MTKKHQTITYLAILSSLGTFPVSSVFRNTFKEDRDGYEDDEEDDEDDNGSSTFRRTTIFKDEFFSTNKNLLISSSVNTRFSLIVRN